MNRPQMFVSALLGTALFAGGAHAEPASDPLGAEAPVEAATPAAAEVTDPAPDVAKTPPPPIDDIPPYDPMLDDPENLSVVSTGELIGTFLKMILMLGIVLLVLYLTLNKGVGKLIQRSQQGKRVRVVERVTLEQRRALYVVNVDGRDLLLAASEGGVHVIDRLGEAEAERKPFRIQASGNASPAPVSRGFARHVDPAPDEPSEVSSTDATKTIAELQKEG